MASPSPHSHRPQPSADYTRLMSSQNVNLAWDRLERAREPSFKWYWRPSLIVARKAKNVIIKRIRNQLKNYAFQPDGACIFSEPKPSTLLRHKAILTIGDHNVYQAIANVIADKLIGKTGHLYLKNIFGNLYSGPRKKFFLQKWEIGYDAFNQANREAFSKNQKWLVQFDFASFYDSIGHGVLEQLLMDLGVGEDLCSLLCKTLLPRWSCAINENGRLNWIVLDSGIPQGPLPSPLLAEVVLSYIDRNMCQLKHVTYLRYADDIRIWSDNREHVQYAAAVLDRLSRNIGIFPQAKKFSIEEVEDVEETLKDVSIPGDTEYPDDEDFLLLDEVTQSKNITRVLWRLIDELSGSIPAQGRSVTLFKRVIWLSDPNSSSGLRLCALLQNSPYLAEPCCLFIERIEAPSAELLDALIDLVRVFPGYPWLSGRILRVLWPHRARLTSKQKTRMRSKMVPLLKDTGIRTDCQVQALSLLFAAYLNANYAEKLEKKLNDPKTSWWAIVYVILNLDEKCISDHFLKAILIGLLGHENREVSRAAAHRLCSMGEKIPNASLDEHDESKAIFKSFGLDNRTLQKSSRINFLYSQILQNSGVKFGKLDKIDWIKLLGSEYQAFDMYATQLYSETGASRDLFCQLLFAAWEAVVPCVWSALNCRDLDLVSGGTLRQSYGTIRTPEMFRRNTDLRVKMPALCSFMVSLHSLRHHGQAAHRRNSHSGLRSRPISFGDMKRLLDELPAAWSELAREFPE